MKNKLDVISNLSGSSKAAVSRAINHCFGVELESRERIVSIAREMGVESSRECDFYCIFPDRPPKYWSDFIVRLSCACGEDLRGKYNVYARSSALLLDEYLNEAKRLGARMILVCARPNEKQRELLLSASRDVPIIFLFDKVSITNTFCICTDAFSDGRLARQMADVKPGSRVLIISDETEVATSRIAGFCDGASLDAVKINISDTFTAAEVARLVSELGAGCFDAVYAAVGAPREAALASIKLGYGAGCTVIGHDYLDVPLVKCEQNGAKYISLCPNTAAVCDAAAKAVSEYMKYGVFPNEKYTVISSGWRKY